MKRQKLTRTSRGPREKLVLTRGSLPPADDKDILRYQRGHGIPTLPLMVAGREVSVAIDTGASSGCVLEQSLEGTVPTKSAPVLVGVARRATSEAKIRQARIDGPLVLGRHVIDSPITSFVGIQSLIGYDVLRHFAITFDAQAKTVRFAREGRGSISFPPRYSSGFGTDQADGVRTVAYVLEGSSAKKAGLRVDDKIVTLNGRPTASYDRAEWRNVGRSQGTLRLHIRRNDKPLEITVPVVLAVP